MIQEFFQKIRERLHWIETEEAPKLQMAAQKISESIRGGGIIQLFGCGHSHILAEEVFYRAGGLVPIKPILIERCLYYIWKTYR